MVARTGIMKASKKRKYTKSDEGQGNCGELSSPRPEEMQHIEKMISGFTVMLKF